MKSSNALLPEVPYHLKDFEICDEAVRLLEPGNGSARLLIPFPSH